MRNLLINLGFFLANLGLLALLLCPSVTAAMESAVHEEGLSMPLEIAPLPAEEAETTPLPAGEEVPQSQGNEPELPRLVDLTPASPPETAAAPEADKVESVPEVAESCQVFRRLPTKDKVVARLLKKNPIFRSIASVNMKKN
ncbi:MAG: hypothetical protein PHS56_07030 [Eubacteriales bacterium]|nr:hypothetical protein [Eubacteriales bacterium]